MPDFVLDPEPTGYARIKVIGVGGGGCNAVDSMYDRGLSNVEYYVVNSDLQALKRTKCPNRIQIGAELTQGRGCGADPRLGERCMQDAKDLMVETISGADIVFVTAGLGGGTGTGAAPVVASFAKEMGILTVAVTTTPFKFEGPRRAKSAGEGLERLRENTDTMIVVNNDRLLDYVGPKVPMREAFAVADAVLANAVQSISDLVATPGLINVDFNDVRTIMGGRGGAVMGVGVGKGENRAQEAVKKATSSPLLDKLVIDGATGVLICITGGLDMTLKEVSEATSMVHEMADPDAEIIFGAVVDESLTDQMRVTLIATGFRDELQKRRAMEENRKGVSVSAALAPEPTIRRPAPPAVPVAETAPPPAPRRTLAEELNSVLGPDDTKSDPVVVEAPKAAAPAPAPAAVASNGKSPSSLRSTLEAMMAEQTVPSQPSVRVAPSSPAVRTAGAAAPAKASSNGAAAPVVAERREKAAVEATPNVKLFNPAEVAEANSASDDDEDLSKPTFMRRKKSLFD